MKLIHLRITTAKGEEILSMNIEDICLSPYLRTEDQIDFLDTIQAAQQIAAQRNEEDEIAKQYENTRQVY
jgi:hypothetical protein